MEHQFQRHYTREEARALLPQIRVWLSRLSEQSSELADQEKGLKALRALGTDLGGELVNAWVRTQVEMQLVLIEFFRREIQIKDLGRGLIDFPAILDEKEVFLCWEKSEADIEFWHELETGYAGRKRLDSDLLF